MGLNFMLFICSVWPLTRRVAEDGLELRIICLYFPGAWVLSMCPPHDRAILGGWTQSLVFARWTPYQPSHVASAAFGFLKLWLDMS